MVAGCTKLETRQVVLCIFLAFFMSQSTESRRSKRVSSIKVQQQQQQQASIEGRVVLAYLMFGATGARAASSASSRKLPGDGDTSSSGGGIGGSKAQIDDGGARGSLFASSNNGEGDSIVDGSSEFVSPDTYAWSGFKVTTPPILREYRRRVDEQTGITLPRQMSSEDVSLLFYFFIFLAWPGPCFLCLGIRC